MLALDLRAEAAAERLPAGPLPKLEGGPRALALSTWRGRMENEHASSLVFAGLLPQAVRAGAAVRAQSELATMIGEEQRHARRCAAMLEALGGEALGAWKAVEALPAHADTTPRLAFFRNLLSVCCLSETVAVALIDAERLALADSVPGLVLREILADEVGHARFGWRTLEEAQLSVEERADLSRYLTVALKHLWVHELAHLSPLPVPTAELAEAGVCDGALARDIFQATVEEVILPSLVKLGLEAAPAWAALRVERGLS